MSLHRLGNVSLLEVFPLLICERLATSRNGFIHAFRAREADNRTGNLGIDPCQGDMCHLPALLIRQLLHSKYNLLVRIRQLLVL